MSVPAGSDKRRLHPGDLRGLKYFRPILALLSELRAESAHPNRLLTCDQYVTLILLYYFSPTLTSLRDIQRASDFKTVAKKLGVRRASLGSLSSAATVFDYEPLKAIVFELAAQVGALDAVPRPTGVPDDLTALAFDGMLLDALPKMTWANWIGPYDKAVKVHLEFDIFRGIPTGAQLTDGNGDKRRALEKQLREAVLYIVDRGYMDYELYQAILDKKSSFVARLRGNVVREVIETRELSPEARAAGVEADEIVWIGGGDNRMKQALRLLKIHIVNPPQTGLKRRGPQVSRKVKSVRVTHTEFDVLLLTDRMDIPAESIALLYKYRWQIEIFFRWLKCTLGCRHLLAQSENGVAIQMYAALIASLLVVLWTGRKPTKVSLFYLNMYFEGWCDLSELMAHLKKLKAQV